MRPQDFPLWEAGDQPPFRGRDFKLPEAPWDPSQCVRLIRLRPRLRDEAAAREMALIEQRHQDNDPALAEDTDQA
jgi:hypothetical protein